MKLVEKQKVLKIIDLKILSLQKIRERPIDLGVIARRCDDSTIDYTCRMLRGIRRSLVSLRVFEHADLQKNRKAR